MYISAKTHIGNIREVNQDRVGYKQLGDHELIAVLCDGMGGHNAGEVAAALACDYILEHFDEHQPFASDEDIKAWLSTLLFASNKLIEKEGKLHTEYEGMGTTAVICYIKDEIIYTSHVGDSRAYLLKGHELEQLTVDDTLVNALLKNGSITEKEAEMHPQKNILIQAVGVTTPLNISFYKITDDCSAIFLCSDGLYNSLSKEQMAEILSKEISTDEKAEELINEANAHGGYDNISVIIVEKGGSRE